MANRSQKGEVIRFTNGTGSDLAVRDPVAIGDGVGVCAEDIVDGTAGNAFTTGVHTFPKVSGADISVGEMVVFDVSAGAVDDRNATPAAGDISDALQAWESAGPGTTTCQCKIVGVGTRA